MTQRYVICQRCGSEVPIPKDDTGPAKKPSSGRELRQYDLPVEDAEAIAATFGVELDPDHGEPPDWFVERFGDR